ncbi:quinol monooxygenase YgiN [Duganella sp. 1224]|uniref:putative quinol monooxygenase n=1 Tax=Duganella sp. 1224 TaxID=2587052 RepID=UPI0015C99FEE|nr:putative quinol monooxygenase [Duganella sp. 1224]NYE63178.1 quinol monooxygenase YgiN [Duganella sp. 1224]
MEKITIVAQARAKPGMEERMVAAQIALVEATRGSAGCLRYELHRSLQDPSQVMFVEEWASYEAWHAHMRSERIRQFQRTGGAAIGDFQLYEMRQVA